VVCFLEHGNMRLASYGSRYKRVAARLALLAQHASRHEYRCLAYCAIRFF